MFDINISIKNFNLNGNVWKTPNSKYNVVNNAL